MHYTAKSYNQGNKKIQSSFKVYRGLHKVCSDTQECSLNVKQYGDYDSVALSSNQSKQCITMRNLTTKEKINLQSFSRSKEDSTG